MLPCCGFFIIPHDIDDTVEITGCPNGIDWSVLHIEDYIKLDAFDYRGYIKFWREWSNSLKWILVTST
jgi:hypothetical protein